MVKNNASYKEWLVENMRWCSAGKGLEVFLEIKAKIVAGERFELSRDPVIQVGKELDTGIDDLARFANNRAQFHLAWSR